MKKASHKAKRRIEEMSHKRGSTVFRSLIAAIFLFRCFDLQLKSFISREAREAQNVPPTPQKEASPPAAEEVEEVKETKVPPLFITEFVLSTAMIEFTPHEDNFQEGVEKVIDRFQVRKLEQEN